MKALLRISVRNGLIAGALGSLAMLILFLINKHPFLLPLIFDFRIVIFSMFIFITLKEYRDYHQGGILYFWEGMIGSYAMVFVAGTIGAIFSFVMAKWNGHFLSDYINKLQEQLTKNAALFIEKVGKEAYSQQVAKLPHTSAGDLAGDYLLKSLIIGIFLAILLSVILRKQPKL